MKKKKRKNWLSTEKKIWNKKRLVEFWFKLLVVREDEYYKIYIFSQKSCFDWNIRTFFHKRFYIKLFFY